MKYSEEQIQEMRDFIAEVEKESQTPYPHVNLDKNIGDRMFKWYGTPTCTGGAEEIVPLEELNKRRKK